MGKTLILKSLLRSPNSISFMLIIFIFKLIQTIRILWFCHRSGSHRGCCSAFRKQHLGRRMNVYISFVFISIWKKDSWRSKTRSTLFIVSSLWSWTLGGIIDALQTFQRLCKAFVATCCYRCSWLLVCCAFSFFFFSNKSSLDTSVPKLWVVPSTKLFRRASLVSIMVEES
jgi:hypothetical protein